MNVYEENEELRGWIERASKEGNAELNRLREQNEKLRGLLRDAKLSLSPHFHGPMIARIDAALAEAVISDNDPQDEPAPAQAEQQPVTVPEGWSVQRTPDGGYCLTNDESAERAFFSHGGHRIARLTSDFLEALLSAAPIAQSSQPCPQRRNKVQELQKVSF